MHWGRGRGDRLLLLLWSCLCTISFIGLLCINLWLLWYVKLLLLRWRYIVLLLLLLRWWCIVLLLLLRWWCIVLLLLLLSINLLLLLRLTTIKVLLLLPAKRLLLLWNIGILWRLSKLWPGLTKLVLGLSS